MKRYLRPDLPYLGTVALLIVIGLIMIYSASAIVAADTHGDFAYYLKKQLVWVMLGIGALVFFAHYDYHRFTRSAPLIYAITLVLLIGVLILGRHIGGAQRWFSFGFMSFQPAELAKVVTLIMLARYIDRKRSRLDEFKTGIVPALCIMGAPIALVMLEPDLGIPFVMITAGMALLFMGGARVRHLCGLGLAVVPVLAIFIFAYSYRIKRVMTFLNPWDDPQGKGYQIIQSLLALGSGGFAGKGLGASTLKLLYLPTPHTDFIFPIIGEELGFIGCMGIIALFIALSIRGLVIARAAGDLFGSLLAAGITFMVTFQALINMAVATGLVPTKGIALPFLSFGGSSLFFTMAAVGIVLNVSRQVRT